MQLHNEVDGDDPFPIFPLSGHHLSRKRRSGDSFDGPTNCSSNRAITKSGGRMQNHLEGNECSSNHLSPKWLQRYRDFRQISFKKRRLVTKQGRNTRHYTFLMLFHENISRKSGRRVIFLFGNDDIHTYGHDGTMGSISLQGNLKQRISQLKKTSVMFCLRLLNILWARRVVIWAP
jgi:hypothetical protein